MVYRFQLTNGEIIDVSDIKDIPTGKRGYYLNPGFYELVDLNNTLKYFLPKDVKVSVTIDDVRLKSNLKNNQTLIFTEKSFFIQIWVLLDHILILYTIKMVFINLLRESLEVKDLLIL